MFSKRQPEATSITVIAGGSVIEGTLRVTGAVQIDGCVEGTLISEGPVSVGPDGAVRGEINADSLSVGGSVEGTLVVRGHLHVLNTGKVRGEARYASLEVDRGGVMDGRTGVLPERNSEAVEESSHGHHVEAVDAAV